MPRYYYKIVYRARECDGTFTHAIHSRMKVSSFSEIQFIHDAHLLHRDIILDESVTSLDS